MQTRTVLKILFSTICLTLLAMTIWASLQQPVWQWQGLTREPDRWWTTATLMDAYYGFVTFFVWVCLKERTLAARLAWFVLIMSLGNIAMSVYVLWQLYRLRPDEPLSAILLPRPQA